MTSHYPVNIHKGYHAHVYFTGETLAFATDLCIKAGDNFGLAVGRVHQRNVGPHPMWSCQITFAAKHFEAFIPWLDAERGELSVLVHALTGNDWDDHTKYAYWLGEPQTLNLAFFKT